VSHPEIRPVEFDQLIPSYRGHEEKFEPHGIHLTPAAFKSYGLFLAEPISIA